MSGAIKSLSSGWADRLWNNQRSAHFVSYILIAAMMVCVAIAIQQAGENLFPGWAGSFLPWLIFFAALEAQYAQSVLRRRSFSFTDPEFWYFRAAEWIVYFVSVRSILYVLRGREYFLQDLARWQRDWLTFFDDPEFILVMIVIGILWTLSGAFGEDVDRVQTKPRDIDFETLPEMQLDRNLAKGRIIRRVLSLGMGLIFLTVVIRLNIGQIFGETLATRMTTLNVLIYFGLGLVLLSFIEYALQRGRWLWERTPIINDITWRWTKYAGIFLLILISLAMLLPTMYTIGLLETIQLLISIISYLVSLLIFAITTLFTLIYVLIFWLLNGFSENPPIENDQLTMPEFNPRRPGLVDTVANPLLDSIISTVFWLSLGLIVILAFGYYVRQNEELISRLRTVRLSTWMIQIWELIRSAFSRLKRGATASFSRSYSQLRERFKRRAGSPQMKYIGLRNLSAREKVYFYYLALLRRGEEIGITRKTSQTPRAYSQYLRPNLPDELTQDLDMLTERFLEARYSMRPIDREQVNVVQAAWRHLRRFLKKKIRQDPS